MQMNSRERVFAALRREEADRVPYCEIAIDPALAKKIMGWGYVPGQASDREVNHYTVEEAKEISCTLGLDNICHIIRSPVYAETMTGKDGRLFYGEGKIRTKADVSLMQLPDPYDDRLYEGAKQFIQAKEHYSAWFVTRVGLSPTYLSMGFENFSLALHDDRELVESVLDRYFDWAAAVAERVSQMGFDVFVSTDDMAFNTAPFFSPQMFHDIFLPRYKRIAKMITIPWIMHTDGNILPFLQDILSIGIAGLHPIEKGAMDIRQVKKEYGNKICLLGNVDLNILGMGTIGDVEAEVKYLIRNIAPGGGYMVSSGNSLADYLIPENVKAMARAVQEYGRYPINI
jgi:uroporphyrinogen decarboxylase